MGYFTKPDNYEEMAERYGRGIAPELPREVWQGRISRCQRKLEERGLDALLIYTNGNYVGGQEWARYFTNWVGGGPLWHDEVYIIIPAKGEPTWVMNWPQFVEIAREGSPMQDMRLYRGTGEGTLSTRWAALPPLLQGLFKEKGLAGSKVGFAHGGAQGSWGDITPHLAYKAIQEGCDNVFLVEASDLLFDLIMVKTDYDIRMMRQTCDLLEDALMSAIDACGDGVREYEVALAYYRTAWEGGSEAACRSHMHFNFRHPSCGGGNRPFESTTYKLKKGDMFYLDVAVRYQGYVGDTSRTVVIGEPSKEQRQVFECQPADAPGDGRCPQARRRHGQSV
ncbi:MAG: M24 family metallopeptidase [Dehalococcoidales bacterium]|nr:M24 family metallopeptidase [Dehalococcoidales bacterium]